jgi:hypothetical protein
LLAKFATSTIKNGERVVLITRALAAHKEVLPLLLHGNYSATITLPPAFGVILACR